ncbi:MAG: glyoxalase/bleomycin resistance/extradiol dioxygenase family protein [Desulfobacteraceae bacterium]|nr:MAG: glyoxalase/bleomycin resistance/extradiol dioxygenase family protein [Desulfobacteraceae bacterium]
MKINSLYPVIGTKNIESSRAFYAEHFDMETTFDSDWYASMKTKGDSGFELAFLDYTHPSVPVAFQVEGKGVLINIEVADVDQVYDRLGNKGVEMVLDIRSEEWGQRHFIIQDPNGILVDVIQNIEASGEYAAQYQ